MAKKKKNKDDDLNTQSEYLSDLVADEENKRVKDINALSSSISKMQKENKLQFEKPNRMQKDIGSIQSSVKNVQDDIWDMQDDLEDMNTDGIEEIEKSTNSILSKLGYTIDSLAKGVTRITISTAQATKEAVSQYGRAISEDISFNKQNIVAMSLARTTPLFGYFASKFMETDVFKNAYANIKEKLGNAISAGWGKVKSFFKRKPKEVNPEEAIGSRAVRAAEEAEMEYAEIEEGGAEETIEEKAEKVKGKNINEQSIVEKKALESVNKKAKNIKENVPKLQAGGYIEKEGLTRVHAAEVVLPIEKVLQEIEKASGSKEIMGQLGQNISVMTEVLTGTERYLTRVEKQQESIIKTFEESYKQYGVTESWQDKMLRATLDMQAGLVGSSSRLEVAWQRTLLEHPTFRNIIAFGETLKNTFTFPLKFLFTARGGYKHDVRKASRSKNAFENIVNVLGLLYSTAMPKLDNISKYLKELAEYTTGKEISPVQEKTWTMFEKIRDFMASPKPELNIFKSAFEAMTDQLDLDKKVMTEAGITGFKSFLHPKEFLGKMNINKESLTEKFPILNKLPFMKEKIPSAATGGKVSKTGLVNVHAGEVITPKDAASKTNFGKRTLNFFDKFLENRFSKWTSRRQTAEEKFQARQQKAQEKFDKRFNKVHEKEENRRRKLEEKLTTKSIKKEQKIADSYTKQSLKYQNKLAKQTMRDQKKIMKYHTKSMNVFTKLSLLREKIEERKQKKLEKAQDKMRRKEEKWLKKSRRIEEKIQKEEEKWQTKLVRIKEKAESKERMKLLKLEGKLKLLEAKKLGKEQKALAKIEFKMKKLKMKEDLKLAKEQMIIRRIELKSRSKELKEQFKVKKAEFKERIKAAKEKAAAAKAELWRKRRQRITDLPDQIRKFREEAKKGVLKRIDLAKKLITGQSKIKKVTQWVGEKIDGLKDKFKSMARGAWKWFLIIFSFLKQGIGMVLGKAVSFLAYLPAIINTLTVGFAKLGGFLLKFSGPLMIAAGALMGAIDSIKAIEEARKWHRVKEGEEVSTSQKTTAAIGGFLGGVKKGMAGIGHGALKGGLIGAGIGATIGTPIPIIGNIVGGLIGGAIGTVAGGILGFIGGENIARGLQAVWDGTKKLIKGIGAFLYFPIKVILDISKKAIKWMKETFSWEHIKEHFVKKFDAILQVFNWIGFLFDKTKNWVKEKMKYVPGMKYILEDNPQTIEGKAASVTSGIPSAAKGGFVTKSGKVNVHAGEIISPLDKTNLAKLQLSGDIIKEQARMKSDEDLRKEMINSNEKNANKMNNIILNMSNMVSSNMKSMSSGTNIGSGSGGDSNGYVSMIVNGNIE